MQTEKIAGRFDCKVYNPKLPKEQWKWIRATRSTSSITSSCSVALRPVLLEVATAADLSAVVMAAVMAATVVMAVMEAAPVERGISAVICGVRILVVNVWEEICVHACK